MATETSLLRDWQAPEARGSARVHEIVAGIEEVSARRSDLTSVLHGLDTCRKLLFSCLAERLDLPVAQAVTLKLVNLGLARYHLRWQHSKVLARPFGLIVDPSNSCNLACPGCVHSPSGKSLGGFQWPKGLMSESRIAELFRRYGPYAIQTVFSNYGEPLLNPDTPKLIGEAKRFMMRTMLSTNMTAQRFDAEALVRSGLDYMVVSLDGATQPVYARYRRHGNIEIAFRNIRSLVAAKRDLGRRTPVIAWHFLTFKHNVHEIPQAVAKARELGVNHFATLTPFDVSWDDPGIRSVEAPAMVVEIDPDNEEAMAGNLTSPEAGLDAAAIERAFESGWREGAMDDEPSKPSPEASPVTCHWLYKSMSMDANGRVFPCCGAPSAERNLVFAQFDPNTSTDPFNSAMYKQARSWFADPAQPITGDAPHCVKCEWQKTAPNTAAAEIQEFLKASAGDLFGPNTLRLVSRW